MRVALLVPPTGVGGTATWSRGLVNCMKEYDFETRCIDVHALLRSKEEYDVIHLCATSVSTTLLSLFHRLTGSKIIFTLHGDYRREFKMTMTRAKMIQYTKAWDGMLRIATVTTTPSLYLKQKYQTDVVIPNGIEFDHFSKAQPLNTRILGCSNNDFIVLSVYNMNNPWRVNDVIHTLQVFGRFNRTNPNSHLLIAGGGRFLCPLMAIAGRRESVSFLGVVRNMPDLYRTASVLLHVTSLDNTPYAVLEAMASSLPIVASKIGGIPELITHGVNGFLIDDNYENYVSTLRVLYEDQNRGIQIGRAAKKQAANYDWSRIGPSFVRLYCGGDNRKCRVFS